MGNVSCTTEESLFARAILVFSNTFISPSHDSCASLILCETAWLPRSCSFGKICDIGATEDA